MTRVPGAIVVANPRVSGMSLNFIAPRATTPDGMQAACELGSALLAGYGRPPALFLSPAAGDMATLGEWLQGQGWRLQVQQAVLALELPAEPLSVSPEVVVSPISADQLDCWGQTLVEAYEVSPDRAQEIQSAWTSLMLNPGDGSRAEFYLAWLGGQPVGTGLTWGQGDLVGLYCGAVLPAFRRRGVERATVVRRLVDAAANGARIAVLQTEAGSPVERLCLQHLGFRFAYSRELWVAPI